MFTRISSQITRKIAVAAALIAVGSMVGVSSASAMKGERGKGKKQVSKSERKNKNNRNVARNRNHVAPAVRPREERRSDRIKRQVTRAIGIIASRVINEPKVYWRDYGPRRVFNGRRHNYFCVAVARTRGGYGRRLGIRTEGFGRRACRKAMRRCNNRLDIRQSRGRNPFAACTIARRG